MDSSAISNTSKKVNIIGAGPSGLACAHQLAKNNIQATTWDQNKEEGGFCRTLNHKRYLFDIGGHRFLTKNSEIQSLWENSLKDDLLKVKRLSRIYYCKKFFSYPLALFNTFWNLGPIDSFLCVLSYLKCKKAFKENDQTFEGWIINRFGQRLYEKFFKSYTEKVWGIKCSEISSQWGRQRIMGLSLRVAIKTLLLGIFRFNTPKTLYKEFLYPKKGPGQFYNNLKIASENKGTQFQFNKKIFQINHNENKIVSFESTNTSTREKATHLTDFLFSTMPLNTFISAMNPKPPQNVIDAANALKYRGFLTVNIILKKKKLFKDQWIYVHEPTVKLARIQNFKNWSPYMVPDENTTSLGLEYFCNENDNLWNLSDSELIKLGISEMKKIGFDIKDFFIEGFIVRAPFAYPIYLLDFNNQRNIIKKYLNKFKNLKILGRAGLFHYCNSDEALMMGIKAANNFLQNNQTNLWDFSLSDEYLES